MRKTLLILALVLLAISAVFGQQNIQAGQTVTQNFDTIGTSATATLPDAWKADKNTTVRLVGSYSAALTATERVGGNDMSTTAGNGIYNFGAGVAAEATDRAIGFLSSSSATKSGNLYLQLTNNGSTAITGFTVSYNVEKYRMGSNTAGFSIQMYYSTDGTTWTSAGDTFTTSIAADATNNGYAAAPGVTINVSGSLPQSLAVGNSLYLAWNYSVTSGTTSSNAQALGVDDVSIIAAGGAPTPTINVSGTLNPFSTTTGTPSASQSYNLSGSNLTANIIVAALAGFQYSTDNSTWVTNLSLANSFNGAVYVRLSGATAGSFSGNIVHSSTGAVDVNVAASGTVSAPTPTIHVVGTPTAFTAITGTPSASQNYTLSGAFLTANIVVTPPAGFAVSTDNTTFNSSLSVASSYNGLIYVRLTGATAGSFSGNITHTSTGATQVDLAVSGTVSDPAVPATFLMENFNYTVGTTASSNGWSAHSGTGTASPLIDATNLSYPNYPLSSGGSVRTTGVTGEDISKNFTSQTSGEIYCAWLMNITSLPNTTQDYCFHLGDSNVPAGTSTMFRGRLNVQRDASNNLRFALSKGTTNTGTMVWTGGTYASGTYDYAMNTTYMFVMKYKIVAGAANDEVYLWINPTNTVSEPAHTLFLGSADTSSDPSDIGSVAIRQANNTPEAYYDGIRITNNWAQLWLAPPTPVISVTGTLDPLACIVGSPSEEITQYTLNGTDLQSGITVTAPTHFQVSLSATEGWAQSILVPATSLPATIYVRMYATLAGDQAGNIVHTSPNADPVNLRVEGTAYNPTVIWNNPASLPEFSSEANTPSAAQSYTLSATNATADLSLNTAAPFEISTSSTGPWGYTLTLPFNFNSSIYVRFNPTSAGTFNGEILHDTADATQDAVLLTGTATPQAGMAVDLFFSEYIEGSSSNKALEIFNGTGGAVDLGNYKVYLYSNGASTPGNTLTFTTGTMLAHNDVYVIANAGANATILGLADVTSTVTYYNGDDAVALVKIVGAEEQYVDIFGMIGQDPGTAWTADGGYSTLDKTLVRKPNINQGVSVNPTGYAAGDVTAFETLASEWDVYAVDTISYLGSHTFNPGGNPMVATPTFNPPAGNYFSPINVTIATTTPGATIRYTTNGDVPNASSTLYTGPVAISATTTLKAIAFATGYDPSSVAIASYSYPTDVANIAALRAMPTGATVYRLTGEAVLTFQQANRNQKYIQDATAAVLIDDPTGIITTTYNLYDGITRIAGTLALYNSLLQFTPVADPGAATSTGNVVVPAVRTLATITSDDQAKLLKIMNVTVDATTVNFLATAENINVTDASGTIVMRTFPATDYSNTAIPTTPVDIVCLGGQYGTGMQISPRFLADFSPASGTLEAPIINISQVGGTISLSWAAVAGATSYRVESSNDPYAGFTLLTTTTNLFYSGAATDKKFYRVIALN